MLAFVGLSIALDIEPILGAFLAGTVFAVVFRSRGVLEHQLNGFFFRVVGREQTAKPLRKPPHGEPQPCAVPRSRQQKAPAFARAGGSCRWRSTSASMATSTSVRKSAMIAEIKTYWPSRLAVLPGIAERRHNQSDRSRCEHEGHERVVAELHGKPMREGESQSEHTDQHEKALAALSFECAEIDLESGEEHEKKQPQSREKIEKLRALDSSRSSARQKCRTEARGRRRACGDGW